MFHQAPDPKRRAETKIECQHIHIRVSIEVMVTIVSKLDCFTYLGDVITPTYVGVTFHPSFTSSTRQDIHPSRVPELRAVVPINLQEGVPCWELWKINPPDVNAHGSGIARGRCGLKKQAFCKMQLSLKTNSLP